MKRAMASSFYKLKKGGEIQAQNLHFSISLGALVRENVMKYRIFIVAAFGCNLEDLYLYLRVGSQDLTELMTLKLRNLLFLFFPKSPYMSYENNCIKLEVC